MNDLDERLGKLVDTEWMLCSNRKLPGKIRAYRWRTGESPWEGAVSDVFDRIEDAMKWLESPWPVPE